MEGTVSEIQRATNVMAGLIMAAIVIWRMLELWPDVFSGDGGEDD